MVDCHNTLYRGVNKIEVVDYAVYDYPPEFGRAISTLRADIEKGSAPDMVYWSLKAGVNGFDPSLFSQHDVFIDLDEFLSTDTEINRSLCTPSIIRSLESEYGGIFELPMEFIIYAVACRRSDIEMDRWDINRFLGIYDAHGSPSSVFGRLAGQAVLLVSYLQNNTVEFINWRSGECRFTSDDFTHLLEFTKTQSIDSDGLVLPNEAISSGSQYLFYESLSDVSSIQKFKAVFGDEVSFIGFPVGSGKGNSCFITRSMSILKDSKRADDCWRLMRNCY